MDMDLSTTLAKKLFGKIKTQRNEVNPKNITSYEGEQ